MKEENDEKLWMKYKNKYQQAKQDERNQTAGRWRSREGTENEVEN